MEPGEVVREVLELLCSGDEGRLDDLVDPDYRDHTCPGPDRGVASVLAWRRRLREAFADVELEPRDLVVAGDGRVTVRLRFRGLHVAPYAGVEPCGQTVEIDEIHIWRVDEGRVVEHWGLRDELAALRQMGVSAIGAR